MDENEVINDITRSIYHKEKEGPNIQLEEALHRAYPTKESGRFLFDLKKQRRNEMNDFNDDDWEYQDWKERHQKDLQYQQRAWLEQMNEYKIRIDREDKEMVAKESGFNSIEEFEQAINNYYQTNPQQGETDYRERNRAHLRSLANDIRRDKRTGRPRDPNTGKFVSPHRASSRADIERAKESQDPDAVLEALLPDGDSIFSR